MLPDLTDADLSQVDLSEASLGGADLRETNLTGANLMGADLRGANLRNAKLHWANLMGANLHGANLSDTDLREANLGSSDLGSANLSNADLGKANLNDADLRGANLLLTKLYDTNVNAANLTGVDIRLAGTRGTRFVDIDLSVAIGLEAIRHIGPSTIGIDTIYKSHGKIPEVFLRGCGVPDEFIAYIGSMVGRPIEYYSCFISYSTHDQEFAERLHADLQAKGVRCWFAPHDIKGGRKIHEQIDEAIRLHDRLLLILSEHSMSSEWVKTEIAKARKREVKEGKRVLFPVRLVGFETLRDWECFDGDTGKDSAREIREYFIPDFSNWKDHDSYQTAFQRLVRDLKAEASK